jgi:hypothetical protein
VKVPVRTVVVGAVAVLFAACGGSHAKVALGPAASSSTTDASPSSVAAPAKQPATKVRPTASTRPTTTTVARGARVVSAPSAGTVVVIPAVAPGGAAPAPLPAPSPASAKTPAPTPAPGRPVTTTTVKPFDPTQPVDLSGTPGVSPAQQAAAEALVRNTLHDLPRFASQSAAFAAGYRTIGDAFTGDEHWVNWAYANDTDILDPLHPESLVYDTRVAGHPTLEAAMFMLAPGDRFTDVPPLFQSPLTQFHVHDNICFQQTADPLQKVFAGLTSNGECPAGQTLAGNIPMLHVWIVKNPCGPFAALLGIGAGQVPAGETANCDTAHAGVL